MIIMYKIGVILVDNKENINNTEEPPKKRGRKKKEIEPIVEAAKAEEPVEEIREVIVEKKAGFNVLEVIIIMVITVLFGILIGSAVTYTRGNHSTGNLPDELQEFAETYQNILDNYYKEVDKNGLLDAGIKGMLDYLDDPYSTYMDVAASQSFNEKVNGSYVGIGCEIRYAEKSATIASCFASSPGSKSGIEKDDLIVSINDKLVSEMAYSDIAANIKGEAGTKVKLTLKREEKEFTVEVTRQKVDLTSVTSSIFEENGKKIGYLKVDIFAANTKSQFQSALQDLENNGIDSLLIDVRNNPGGHLSQVSEILSLFLDKSKIMYKIDTKGDVKDYYALTNEKRTYPIGILINEESASASEILAAAMKESYGATLIGEKTYGKGTVQEAYELSDGSTVKYTTKKWLTPNGNWINEVGVSPDVEIEMDEAYYKNPSTETDNQFFKAIEVMLNK